MKPSKQLTWIYEPAPFQVYTTPGSYKSLPPLQVAMPRFSRTCLRPAARRQLTSQKCSPLLQQQDKGTSEFWRPSAGNEMLNIIIDNKISTVLSRILFMITLKTYMIDTKLLGVNCFSTHVRFLTIPQPRPENPQIIPTYDEV